MYKIYYGCSSANTVISKGSNMVSYLHLSKCVMNIVSYFSCCSPLQGDDGVPGVPGFPGTPGQSGGKGEISVMKYNNNNNNPYF